MKYLVIIPALVLLAGLGVGTPWLFSDPDFMQGSKFYPAAFQPGSVTALEVVASPMFSLIGQGFDYKVLPRPWEGAENATVLVGSRKASTSPPPISFDDFEEKSLNYARTKSSLRVANNGTWTPLDVPGLL
jgi:hypothetical protein